MKRTREVTIIHYRRRRTTKRRAATVNCSICGPHADMITVAAAAEQSWLDRQTGVC